MAQTLEASVAVPPLWPGDHLSREEFHRRYLAMPKGTRAELIDGVVYFPWQGRSPSATPLSRDMPSPISLEHSRPHSLLLRWLSRYEDADPTVEVLPPSTILLDFDKELQPDALMRVLPEHGGQTVEEGLYLRGAPEFIAEVTRSSADYDLFEKKDAYAAHGTREFVCLLVKTGEVRWFSANRSGQFEEVPADTDGLHRSRHFPGLWLDGPALLRHDRAAVSAALTAGLAGR